MIVVYDVNVERVNKVRAFLRQYLDWIQNSVFEGELTKATMREVEAGLEKLIVPEEDSIIIYRLRNVECMKKKFIGEPKSMPTNVI